MITVWARLMVPEAAEITTRKVPVEQVVVLVVARYWRRRRWDRLYRWWRRLD